MSITQSEADVVIYTEGNIETSDKASVRKLRRCLRPVHAAQRYVDNWGEPAMSMETREPWYVDSTKGGKQTRCRQSDGPIVPMKA